MPPAEPPQMSTKTVRDAFEQLLEGRVDRREFIRVAVQLGTSAAIAASMAGAAVSALDSADARLQATGRRPNIILILADDMGFSDLGIVGSEIRTPNIDSMARNGVLLSSMYNAARCCPTRAALLTGLYSHRAGIGHMGTDLGTHQVRPFVATSFYEHEGVFSPDGRWVAYVSDETGSDEVYMRSFPDGAQVQRVSSSGGNHPRWRGDGCLGLPIGHLPTSAMAASYRSPPTCHFPAIRVR